MIENKVDEIITSIDKIGVYLMEKLELPLNKAIEIMVKQAKVELIKEIIYTIPFIVLCLFIGKIIKLLKKYSDDEGSIILCSTYIIFTFIYGVIVLFGILPEIIQILINPEYFIAQNFLNLIK